MIRELTGWHVLTALLAFFAITLGVNLTFVYVALDSATGEYQRKSYLQGLRYNAVLAERRTQETLGWRAELGAERTDTGSVQFELRLSDAQGKALLGQQFHATLRRPVQAAMDRDMAWREEGEGRYRADVTGLAKGQWTIVLDRKQDPSNPAPFHAERTLWLP